MIPNRKISQFKTLLKEAEKITIISHPNPDGDALGSSLSLYHYLKLCSKTPQVVMPNSYPHFLEWMPAQDVIWNYDTHSKYVDDIIDISDLIIIVDFNSLDRLSRPTLQSKLEKLKSKMVVIDHHLNPDEDFALLFSYEDMGSTAEILYHIITNLSPEMPLDVDVASCLYTGILTDSGSFRYPRTTANTHRVVASLIDVGIDNIGIYNHLYSNDSPSRLKLLGKALENLVVLTEYQAAFIFLTKKELDACGYRKGDTEGFVNFLLSIENVNFATIFTESLKESIIKISFRSIEDFDVSAFSKKYFNGGGHKNAAGGKSYENLEMTIKKFKQSLYAMYK